MFPTPSPIGCASLESNASKDSRAMPNLNTVVAALRPGGRTLTPPISLVITNIARPPMTTVVYDPDQPQSDVVTASEVLVVASDTRSILTVTSTMGTPSSVWDFIGWSDSARSTLSLEASPNGNTIPPTTPDSVLGPTPTVRVSNSLKPSSVDTSILPSCASCSSTLSTAKNTPLGGPQCEQDANCAKYTRHDENHRAEIAGGVVGAVALAVVILMSFLFFRRRRRKAREREIEGAATWLSKGRYEPDGSLFRQRNPGRDEHDDIAKSEILQTKPADVELGEPRSAIAGGGQEDAQHRVDQQLIKSNGYRARDSTWSQSSSTPFDTPLDQQTSDNSLSRSKIGLALTTYLPAETAVIPLVSRPLSPKKHSTTVVRHDVSSGTESNKHLQPGRNAADVKRIRNRSSYISVQSNAQTFFIGQARTARRHSLTPRIINIVSSSHTSNDSMNSKADHRPAQDQNKRLSTRARSASPAKTVVYSGSPAKLDAHFGIETWGRELGRASSGKQGPEQADAAGQITALCRERRNEGDGNISYPPTSYPQLGRTMSEVKRNIRLKRDQAFTNSNMSLALAVRDQEALPGSVTVERGGKGGGERAGMVTA